MEDRIDLLKVDAEGYESGVFVGMSSREVYRGLLDQGFVDRSGIVGEPGDSALDNRLLVWGPGCV